MQPDALSEAHRKVTRQRLKTLYVAGAIIVAGLLLLVVMKYVGSADEAVQAEPEPPQAAPVKAETADGSIAREQFKQALKGYETNVEDRLALTNLPAWSPETEQDISALKQQALTAFSQADYQTALKQLSDLRVLAEQTLADWDKRYSQAFDQALTFFNQLSPDRAKLSIDQALLLKPSEAEAQTLKQRIDVLPEVKRLLEQANIARIENDIRKRYRLLQQVTMLDPLRVELQDEITRLQGRIAEEDFIAFINAGLQAVDRNRLADARAALRNARAIFPRRRETQILAGRISSLASTLSLSRAINKADEAARRDDWAFALVTYQQALKQHPDNGELADKVQLAQRIVTLNQAVSDYVDRHHRLSSLNVAARAEKALQDAAQYTDKSRTLASRSARLASLLERYNQPAELFIRSDNQTYVTIRGVGRVGQVEQKRITLRPGRYTLEGKRPGYKSKLLNIEIALGQQRFTVDVICDEPI